MMTEQYSSVTGVQRFDFQLAACAHARGVVLNVGANEDPAQLQQRFGTKIVNCDLMAYDTGMGRPNVVDKVFDMTEFPWPFEDGYADLVLMGDVLEHMPYSVIVDCMKEAARVGREMCITVPEDHRIDEAAAQKAWKKGEYNEHTTILTETVLREALTEAGWKPYIMLGASWGFQDPTPERPEGTTGWCVMAHKL